MGKTVLIADDSIFMRWILQKTLTDAGYHVVGEAENGQMAVELYQKLRPDIVTMDITMSVMDGIKATEAIIGLDPGARVVMCSAMGQKALIREALEAGAKDFIVKPFNPQQVIEVLNKVGQIPA
ncbi:MAG: response regulator [Syntrophothermus sp.]